MNGKILIGYDLNSEAAISGLESGLKWNNTNITYYDSMGNGYRQQIDKLMDYVNILTPEHFTRVDDPAQADIVIQFNKDTDGATVDVSNRAQAVMNFNTDMYSRGFPVNTGVVPGADSFLHELGHAIGLKHPFDGGPLNNSARLDGSLDNKNYTLMSYNYTKEKNLYDGVFSPGDVTALQAIYGNGVDLGDPTNAIIDGSRQMSKDTVLWYTDNFGSSDLSGRFDQLVNYANSVSGIKMQRNDGSHSNYATFGWENGWNVTFHVNGNNDFVDVGFMTSKYNKPNFGGGSNIDQVLRMIGRTMGLQFYQNALGDQEHNTPPVSIMSTNNPDQPNGKDLSDGLFSPLDIQALQKLYGPSPCSSVGKAASMITTPALEPSISLFLNLSNPATSSISRLDQDLMKQQGVVLSSF